MKIYRGGEATIQRYNAALSDPNSRVVFVAHTSHDETGKITADVLHRWRRWGQPRGPRSLHPPIGRCPNGETSLQALGPAAAAFVTADAAARPANGQPATNAPNPVNAANQALQKNKRREDLDGDRVRLA